jgi:hypothetical protein
MGSAHFQTITYEADRGVLVPAVTCNAFTASVSPIFPSRSTSPNSTEFASDKANKRQPTAMNKVIYFFISFDPPYSLISLKKFTFING